MRNDHPMVIKTGEFLASFTQMAIQCDRYSRQYDVSFQGELLACTQTIGQMVYIQNHLRVDSAIAYRREAKKCIAAMQQAQRKMQALDAKTKSS